MILLTVLIVFLVGGLLLRFFGAKLVSRYNSLMRVDENVDQAWSNVDVILKQRNDELSKLLDTVSAFQDHEQEILDDITQARKESMQAGTPKEQAEANAHVRQGLGRLFAVAEDYPELKSSENFQQLQDRISDLEERIADRRELYNESVAIFNAQIKQIPDVLFAQTLNYFEREMFEPETEVFDEVDIHAELST